MQQQSEAKFNDIAVTNFGRRLDGQNRLKDRLIIQHLRRHKDNFLFDFDENLDRASFFKGQR